jgi:hypothetical protein
MVAWPSARSEEPRGGAGQPSKAPAAGTASAVAGQDKKLEVAWSSLVNDAELSTRWTATNFGGEGEVQLKDGLMTLGFGSPLTGVTYKKQDFPTENYEMRWEARRTSGQDFFAGVTFPIGEQYCSFIAGGWGGSLTGISSIDGYDASENDTTGFEDFKNNEWYRFRVRVDGQRLKVWINDREVVDIEREGHQFSVRIEVDRCQPLGYCIYDCSAEIRRWEYRLLKAAGEDGLSRSVPAKPAAVEDEPFVRLVKNEDGGWRAMQTAIASYRLPSGPFAGAHIDLIGAVHVGEKKYYAELNRRFQEYDALLFELVADPDVRVATARQDRGVYNPLSAMQVGMKEALELTFQLDEIDYSRKNFVHADMTPDEFVQDMEKRRDNFLGMFARMVGASLAAQASESSANADAKMLAALMSDNRAISLRRVMAEQFESMDVQLSGLADPQGRSTLLTERNAKAMEVLRRQLEQGQRKLGVFYGAAHLADMDRRLIADFHAERGATHWLDAWRLDRQDAATH